MSSNHEGSDNGAAMFFGGVIGVIALVAFVLKALKGMFIEVAAAFEAFSNAAVASFTALFRGLEVAALVAAIIALPIAAIYFTYRYYLMVKKGTDLKRYVETELDARFTDFRATTEKEFLLQAQDLRWQMNRVQGKLDELLKPATATPVPVPIEESAAPEPSDDATELLEGESLDEEATAEDHDEHARPMTASQPF